MLLNTSIRTLLFAIFNLGRVILYTWTAFMVVYLLFIKECLKILLVVISRLKRRFIWVMKELSVDNLWHAFLEEAQNRNFKPMIFESNEHDVYMCRNCQNVNRPIYFYKTFNLKTPLRKSLSDSTNVREHAYFNKVISSQVLDTKNIEETSESQNTLKKEKTYASVYCQCEPRNILNNQTLLKCDNDQNSSKNTRKTDFSELHKRYKEACTSPLIRQDSTPESVKIDNKLYVVDKSNSGSRFKSVNLTTPLVNSPTYIMPISETPTKDFNILRRSRLELMFSNEDPFSKVSPENQSFLKKNWNKWKRVSKIDKINFKRKNIRETDPIVTGQTSTQPDTNKIDSAEGRNSILITIQTPEIKSCCGNMLCTLKTKFNQNTKESSVSYKKF